MKIVYLLESVSDAEKRYIGITDDLSRRLSEHNAGKSVHTRGHMP